MIVNRTDALCNFQFEDNVTNSTGGTNGTVTGNTQYANSISGRAFDFDGSTYIEFGNSGLSNASDLTIFMRMNLDSHTVAEQIISKGASNANGFFVQIQDATTDTIRFSVRNAADSARITVEIDMPETNMYALRLEINLTNEITISYYKTDGTFATASTAFTDATYTSNASNITLANFAGGGGSGCDGVIDDVTICTSILTDEDFYRYYLGMGIKDL